MKDLIMNVHETSSTIRQQDYAPTGIIQIQVPHSSCWLTRVLILEGLASSEEDRVKLSLAFVTESDILKSCAFVMTIGSFLAQSTSKPR